MSELSDKIRAITLAFNEREISRSMKESRFLREINRSRECHNLFVVGNTGESFSVAEGDSLIAPNHSHVQMVVRYKDLF